MLATIISWASRRLRARRDPVGYARSLGVVIGEGSQIFTSEIDIFGSEPYLVTLGQHCYITSGVRFITHDGGVLLFRSKYPDADLIAPIKVGNNVYFGVRSMVMPGVTIGNNCIIGAGAIVTRDLPHSSVVVGAPARVVRTIEEYETKLVVRSLKTGRLQPAEKEHFLKEHFRKPNPVLQEEQFHARDLLN